MKTTTLPPSTRLFFFFNEFSKLLSVKMIGNSPKHRCLDEFVDTLSKTPVCDYKTRRKNMLRMGDSVTKDQLKENILQLFALNFREVDFKDPQIKKLIGNPYTLEPYALEFTG